MFRVLIKIRLNLMPKLSALMTDMFSSTPKVMHLMVVQLFGAPGLRVLMKVLISFLENLRILD